MREEWKKVAQPKSWRDRAEWKSAINGNPWGLASFCALGRRGWGSSEPTGQEEGSSVAGEKGDSWDPLEERASALPPQTPYSK